MPVENKSIREWLQDLPEPIRSQALANMWWEDADTLQPNLHRALRQAFNWSRSPEGSKYWLDIFLTILLDPDLNFRTS